MKKIISIILCAILIAIGVTSYAEDDPEIDLKFTNSVTVPEGQKEVKLTLEIESITDIPDNASVGYQANVKYDKEVFESITIKKVSETSKWDVGYNQNTGVLLCELEENSGISANMQIAEIILTIKEDAKKGETTVGLKGTKDDDALITVQTGGLGTGIEYTKVYESTATINIQREEKTEQENANQGTQGNQKEEEKKEEKKEEITQNSQVQAQPQNAQLAGTTQNTQTNQNTAKEDKTTAKTAMPATGIKTILIFLLIVAIIGGIYLIRYKSIQLK